MCLNWNELYWKTLLLGFLVVWHFICVKCAMWHIRVGTSYRNTEQIVPIHCNSAEVSELCMVEHLLLTIGIHVFWMHTMRKQKREQLNWNPHRVLLVALTPWVEAELSITKQQRCSWIDVLSESTQTMKLAIKYMSNQYVDGVVA